MEPVNWKKIDHVVFSLIDPQTKTTVLILEGWGRMAERSQPHPGVQEVLIYRPADHPIPAFRIQPMENTSPHYFPKWLRTEIFGIERLAIDDVPDRRGRRGTDRRFAWGGHRFVRRPLTKHVKHANYFAAYEYFNSTPQPGSKTGKQDDDSLPQRLFWVDSNSIPLFSREWKAFAAAGLDPLLQEYLAATQLMELAIVKVGASKRPEESASYDELVGLIAAKSIIVNLLLAVMTS